MLKKIHHLGYAVSDLGAAARLYRGGFGVVLTPPETVEEQGIVAAMFGVGESRVELVQPTREDSPVGRFLARRGEGFHHVAYEVDDLAAALATLEAGGVELIDRTPRIGAGDTRMAFVHPKGVFGVLTELVESPRSET